MKTTVTQTLMTGLLVLALWTAQTQAQVSCANENTAVPATTPTADFTLHSDGTATHNTTGLMWMRCSLGQNWESGSCTGSAATYIWADALAEGEGSNFAGHSDWRLPNRNELSSIVERRCYSPSINAAVFPNTPSGWFWSSSPYASYSDYAWIVYFYGGDDNVYGKGNGFHARLVRSGQ